MTYKDYITQECQKYAKAYKKARFIGYNVAYGSRMYGTLSKIRKSQLIETPVAENLMTGIAIGMAMNGYRPVLCFERHDFILLALDALVNHLDKMPLISGGQYKLPVLVRAIIGSKFPLDAGVQHTQDYTMCLSTMMQHTHLVVANGKESISHAFDMVGKTDSGAVILVEQRDKYDEEI